MTSRIKTTRGARYTAGGFRGCWSSVDAQNHGGGVSLFREVNINGAVLPEKVVDKSTREALTRWISCRGLTTSVAESHSILVRRLLTMINTGIGQRCDSDSSVPEMTGLKGCLLHGIKRLSQIKYPMCQRSQISLLYQSQLRNQWRIQECEKGGVTQPSLAGGLGGAVSPPTGSGAESRRQTHFGNNLLKIGWKSDLWVAPVFSIFCTAAGIGRTHKQQQAGCRRIEKT